MEALRRDDEALAAQTGETRRRHTDGARGGSADSDLWSFSGERQVVDDGKVQAADVVQVPSQRRRRAPLWQAAVLVDSDGGRERGSSDGGACLSSSCGSSAASSSSSSAGSGQKQREAQPQRHSRQSTRQDTVDATLQPSLAGRGRAPEPPGAEKTVSI